MATSPLLEKPERSSVNIRSIHTRNKDDSFGSKILAASTKGKNVIGSRHKPPNPYRVEKTTTKSSHDSKDLVRQFSNGIEKDRSRLMREAEANLATAEEMLKVRLEEIERYMQEALSTNEEREAKLFTPISTEVLKLTERTTTGKRDIFATLGDRMVEFDKIVKRHQEGLQKLWDEWIGVQNSIIAVAVEVLGPQNVQIEDEITTELGQAIGLATSRHKVEKKKMSDLSDQSNILEQAIQEETQQTITTSEEIEKVKAPLLDAKLLLT
ncbi:MAG: hypothetical protein Q9227_008597 [Pyrenula ochraceoflavens]